MPPLILIVDDEFVLRSVLADIFADAGYRVLSAGDGREALAMAERDPPDVVLSDVMMPILDGVSLVRHLRERGVGSAVVLMSAGYAKVDLPGVRFLRKPFDLDHILETVQRSLDGKMA